MVGNTSQEQLGLVREIAALPHAGNAEVGAKRASLMDRLGSMVVARGGYCTEEVAVAAMFGAREEEDGCYSSRVPYEVMGAISLAREIPGLRGRPFAHRGDFEPGASNLWLGRMPLGAVWLMYGFENQQDHAVRGYGLAMGLSAQGALIGWTPEPASRRHGRLIQERSKRRTIFLHASRRHGVPVPRVLSAYNSLNDFELVVGRKDLLAAMEEARPNDLTAQDILTQRLAAFPPEISDRPEVA